MKTHQNIILSLLLSSLFIVLSARAAEQPRVYLERFESFGLRVLIDSEQPVNAYDVEVTYDPTIVDIDFLNTGNSIVTVLPRPIRAEGGKIIIKGGSTTAFSGTGGELLSVKLKPVKEGLVQLVVAKSTAYRADGAGTEIAMAGGELPLRVTPDSFKAYQSELASIANSSNDAEVPEIVVATITENPLNFGERLLVFQAIDLDSGISHYEARDRQWLAWSPWREAVNPYPMSEGAWAVQLRAVNNDGNFALATVYQFGNAIWKVAVLVVLLAVLIGGLLTLRGRRSAL